MTDIGYLGALIGGVLALLSPCSALLIPSFFAFAFQRPGQVFIRTSLFTLGLMLTLVPLGVGSTFVSNLFFDHRSTMITIAGWATIGFGVLQILGIGFASNAAQRAMDRTSADGADMSAAATVALGGVYGFAGFCSGPILGSVLAIASLSGRPVYGGLLLAMYALGMAVPLFLLAFGWERWRIGERRWLRGRAFAIAGRQFHTTSVISGLVFIAIGATFLWFDGTAGLFSPVGVDTEASAQEWLQRSSSPRNDVYALLALGAAAIGWFAYRRFRSHPGR